MLVEWLPRHAADAPAYVLCSGRLNEPDSFETKGQDLTIKRGYHNKCLVTPQRRIAPSVQVEIEQCAAKQSDEPQ